MTATASLPRPRAAGARGSRRRLAFAIGVWSLFALIQTVLDFAASPGAWTFWTMLVADLMLAAFWVVLTGAIARYAAFVDRSTTRPVPMLVAHVAGVLVVSALDTAWLRFVIIAFGETGQPFFAMMLFRVDFAVIVYLAIVVVARAGDAHALYTVKARRELTLRAQVAGARLQYLEAQLRPHFLFNALGAIAELAHEAPRAASRMLRQLAAVLRFALDGRGGTVTLADELTALEPYLDIQRVRFADWLVIEQDVDDAALGLRVPRLLLQPLVENALRHGLVNRTAVGHLRIAASIDDGRLRLSVRDNGAGLPSGGTPRGFGLGLGNMRERLATIYGESASLSLAAHPDGGTVAEVVLPMNRDLVLEPTTDEADGPQPTATTPFFDWLRAHPALAVVGGWTIWGILWLQQSIAYLALRGRMQGMSLPRMTLEHLASAYVWAALTPIVFYAARRFPLDPGRMRWSSAIHLPLACAVAFAQSAAFHWIIRSKWSLLSPSYAYMMLWSLSVYALFVGLAHYHQLAGWLRERDVATSRLEADLAEARLASSTSRSQPERILDTLEQLADTVVADPPGTERALAALAGQLRRALDGRAPLLGLDPAVEYVRQ
jgi:two-component system, LytTR family, sensor kinase